MTQDYAVLPQDSGFAVGKKGEPLATPAKRLFLVPTRSLADAIVSEFALHGKFAAGKMPITTLAQTAIDRIDDQRELIVESLLVYVDTDALVYRSSSAEPLLKLQQRDWDPVLQWAQKKFGTAWETTQGIMPVDQSPALHDAIRTYLNALDAMRLAACCMLSATYSSVVLAIAVVEGYISAEGAYLTSRLEEEAQAEIWGRDPEAQQRADKIKEEIIATGRFLDLLKAA